jgi:RimJ/RimL family protein N-acetyltransferase
MRITLRNLKIDDWRYFTKWWHDRELINLTSGNYKIFSNQEIKKSVRKMISSQKEHHWLIEVDQKTVGHVNLCRLNPDKAELQIVIGEKEYWAKGIGTTVVIKVLRKAITLKYKLVYVEVKPTNQRAINLYIKAGFENSRLKKYKNKNLPEVLTMIKAL